MSENPSHPSKPPERGGASYLDPYFRALEQHGASFEATLWKNPEMQKVRFDVFVEMMDLTGRVILDAGSGQGELAAHLDQLGVAYGRYIGLDALPEMVQQSRERKLPEAEFHHCDFAGEEDAFSRFTRKAGGPGLDVVVFSGALNTLDEDFSLRVLQRAWEVCDEALLFNFLSDRTHPRLQGQDTAPAHRFNAVRMVDWVLERTPSVRFRQDYFQGHDASVGMFKIG